VGLLEHLQTLVERTYDVENPQRVTDFLITCPTAAASIGFGSGVPDSSEQVFVASDEEQMDLAVYMHPDVIERLAAEDPRDALHDGNLDDFWTALEGVSHFVYLVWSARMSRQVTQLELELQAEVDKFVLTSALVAAQRGGQVPRSLHAWLFDLPRIDARLAAETAERYVQANRYAGRYCLELISRFLRGREQTSMMPELRRFYRLSQRGKIRRIEAGPS